jgi:hypothetical protein
MSGAELRPWPFRAGTTDGEDSILERGSGVSTARKDAGLTAATVGDLRLDRLAARARTLADGDGVRPATTHG